jgi:hypothetical protein
MFGLAFMVVSALALAGGPQPAPSATPLKTIVNERASPFCAQLRQTIGMSVQGLLRNDEWVGSAKSILAKMGRDWVQGGGASVAMDRVRLDAMIGGIVHNLTVIDDLIASSQKAGRYDDSRLSAMRAELLLAADQQREVLNILGLVLDSSEIDSQLADFYKNNPRASRDAIASVEKRFEKDPMVYRDPVLGQVTGLFGDSPYAHPLLYLIANDLQTHELESKAAGSILRDGSGCHSDVPLTPPNEPFLRPSSLPSPVP